MTAGDVFRTEVSLKTLELAPIGPEVALKEPEVALKEAQVALKGRKVALKLNISKEKIKGLGRVDAMEHAIAVHLSCGYGGRPVLDGVSLEMREEEAVLLAVPNGGGKSTFLKTVIGEFPLTCRRTES